MKKKISIIAVAALLSITVGLCLLDGCARQNEAKTPASGKSGFAVDNALIGPLFNIAGTDKSIQPPVNFSPAPDTVLQMLQRNFEQGKGTAEGVRLVQCFMDTIHLSGLLVTTIEGLNLASDTIQFMNWYRQSLVDHYGAPNIHEGNSRVDDIVVRSFLASDSAGFRYQFLCISPLGNAVELNFFGPRNFYSQLARSFESSVGSIKTIRP